MQADDKKAEIFDMATANETVRSISHTKSFLFKYQIVF